MSVIGRRRRPRWLILGVSLTFMVLVLNAVVAGRSDDTSRRVANLSYLDRVRAPIEQSNRQGEDLADVRANAGRLGRAGITRRLERIGQAAERAVAAVRTTDAPSDLADARSLLLSALLLRARATTLMADALSEALGRSGPGSAASKLIEVGRDLVAADRSYIGFMSELRRARLDADAQIPASQWVDDTDAWLPGPVSAFVTALRSSATLAPVHDVTVVMVTTDPPPVRTENGALVLPATRALRLQAIVANVGNEAERNLKVEATLVPGGARATARDFVSLAPGQRVNVMLGGLQPIPQQLASLTVRIDPAPDEATPQDNEKAIALVVR